MTQDTVQAGVGTAHLSSELDDDGPYTIHGVAIGAGDITVGNSGIKKKWPGDELRNAASTLEGKPLVRDHQNNTDGRVGTVTEAHYREGVGVLYEAEIAPHYEQLAQDIAAGIQEVSARAYHDPVDELEEDDETGALVATNIIFDNLSVVSQGAAPSNTANIGDFDPETAVAMAQGPQGDAVATLESNVDRDALPDDTAENRPRTEPAPDMSDMPKSMMDDTPEWEEGDMVRWQIEPDLFGKIVHVDDEKHVAMVEIMGMESGEMTSTGFTITAGFSDIKPMKVPESKSDLSKHEDDEEMAKHGDDDASMEKVRENDDLYNDESAAEDRAEEIGCDGTHSMEIDGETMYMPCDDHDTYESMVDSMKQHVDVETIDELAEVSGMDINGLVMWDGNMGTIAGFMQDDDELMIEIDLVERDDGRFETTGETVTKSLHDMDSMSVGGPDDGDEDVAELAAAWHTPEWSGLDEESEWSKPAMEDFETDDMSKIDDHFIVSDTGEWPPENYGDLSLPVVFPNGDLSLDGLDSAHQMAGQVDGISDEMANELQSKINGWAQEHFDTEVAGEEMSADSDRELTVASLSDDDPITDDRASTDAGAALTIATHNTETMTLQYEDADDDDIEALDEPVVLEQEDVESLRNRAETADKLDDRLEDVNATLDELADNQETLEAVDEDVLDELSEHDDPVVLAEAEHDELRSLVDDVGEIYAEELAEYSPFDTEELMAKFTPVELKDKVEEHDDAELGSGIPDESEETEPKGGSANTEELEDNEPEDGDVETEAREKIAEQLADSGLDRQAEKVRSGDIELDELGVSVDA